MPPSVNREVRGCMEKRMCAHSAPRASQLQKQNCPRTEISSADPKSSAASAARVKYCCRDSPRDECSRGSASLLPPPWKAWVMFCPQSRSGTDFYGLLICSFASPQRWQCRSVHSEVLLAFDLKPKDYTCHLGSGC